MIKVLLSQEEVGYIPFVWMSIDPIDPNALGGVQPC